jgi:2,3-bisphosphoglycerate-dependent phosphoglycerate mutase
MLFFIRRIRMTTIYFIRHAEPDYNNHDDLTRPLTEKGKRDAQLVNKFLKDKQIDIVMSSPFNRAIETVKGFSDMINRKVIIVEDFRERKVDSYWIEDFNEFSKIRMLMPWVVKFTFDSEQCLSIEKVNVFAL